MCPSLPIRPPDTVVTTIGAASTVRVCRLVHGAAGGAVVEVPDAVLAELVGPVAYALPLIAARIPTAPAAELGRLRATADGETWPIRGSAVRHRAVAPFRFGGRPGSGDSPVGDALGSLPSLLTERLLGALELTVPELDLAGAPDLTGFLGEPFTGNVGMASV